MMLRLFSFATPLLGCALASAAIAATDFVSAPAMRTDLRGVRAHVSGYAAPLPAWSAGAGSGAWSSLGPPGGDVSDVVASPTQPGVVLAGTAPGGSFGGNLYRSTDAGVTWVQVPALAGTSVFTIAFGSDGKAYAATQDSVWTSSDDGETWTHQNLGIDPLNDAVFEIVVDPGNPETVWAGITDAAGFQTVNLMRSQDGGVTWQDRTPPHSAPMTGAAIAIDPGDPATVIAGFHGDFGGGEVWVTADGGDTWRDRSAGLPGTPVNALVYDGTRLLVGGGQNFGSQYLGLYSSPDLGMTWTPLHDASWPLPVVTGIAVDPADTQTILVATDGAGLNRTTDGGASWAIGIGNSGALATQSVRYAPGSSQKIFVATTSLGVFASGNGGDDLAGSSNGISELSLFSVAIDPLDSQQIAAAFQGSNNGGVFSSSDGGVTWALENVPPTRYSKVGYAPSGVLYAISSGPSSVAPEGLYRREANGSWTGLGPDQGSLYESDLAALRFSANDPALILLGGSDFGVAGNEQTVWRTTDGGLTWVKQYEGEGGAFVGDIEIIEDGTDQTMVAAYTGYNSPDQGGVLRSLDGGATWTPGYTQATYAQRPMLCGSPGHPQTLFMGTATGWTAGDVLRSDDGGANWTPTGWTGAAVVDLVCDPLDDHVLYLALNGSTRAMRSADQGVTFSAFASGLETAGFPRALAITQAPGSGARLLMATDKGSYATPLPAGDVIFADGFD
jgi:hypothetical protein